MTTDGDRGIYLRFAACSFVIVTFLAVVLAYATTSFDRAGRELKSVDVGGGWLIVAIIELMVWRSQSRPVAAYVPQPTPAEEEPASRSQERSCLTAGCGAGAAQKGAAHPEHIVNLHRLRG